VTGIIRTIMVKIEDIKQASLVSNNLEPESNSSSVDLDIGWFPQNESGIKVNCDDIVVEYGLKAAACGGVIRMSNGEFVVGFSLNLGACSITIAELFGPFIKVCNWQRVEDFPKF